MEQWYKILVRRAHRGAGRNDWAVAYIYANNASDAFRRYQKMPGVKRRLGLCFPNISPVSPDESMDLERKIKEEGRIPLSRAKKHGIIPN